MASACQLAPAELECAICCELLIDPRSLVCSHTFCMKCILLLYQSKQDDSGSVDCPLCRQVTPLEEGSLSSLKLNVEVQTAVESLEKKNNSLKERVEERLYILLDHVSLISDVEDVVNVNCSRATNDIEEAFNDGLQSLTDSYDELIEKCRQYKRDQIMKLSAMREADGDLVSRISGAFENINIDATTQLLEGETLAIHESACSALENLLDQDEPDASEANDVAEHSGCMKFVRTSDQGGAIIGTLEGTNPAPMDVANPVIEVSVGSDKVSGMVMLPNGKVAIGLRNGGIQFFNKDGGQETVLQNVRVWALAGFTDGGFVVRDRENNITLFSHELVERSTTFETLCRLEGGDGSIDVDNQRNIYVSYWIPMEVHVFTEDGCQPIRVISCSGTVPYQICVLNQEQICVQYGPTIQVIDEGGATKYEVTEGGVVGYPALDVVYGGVLIAWVNDKAGLLSIDRYRDFSGESESLVKDYKVGSAWPSQCYMKVSNDGFVVFYRNSNLYFFHIPAWF